MEIVGHILGFIATAILISSYQIHNKQKLLVTQTIGVACFCVHYILIGAYSGFALNVVCAIRNLIYNYMEKKGKKGWVIPAFLSLCIAGVSVFSWDGYHSLFIISGLMLNTFAMGVCNTQNLRKTILISCPLVLAYNLFELSFGGALNESLSIISAAIGIVRYNREKK